MMVASKRSATSSADALAQQFLTSISPIATASSAPTTATSSAHRASIAATAAAAPAGVDVSIDDIAADDDTDSDALTLAHLQSRGHAGRGLDSSLGLGFERR